MKNRNPWLGLASYNDEAIENGYIFCGRSVATLELYSLVDNNIFVTLYGKSGIGKSSLLQAGLFPKLRANNYFPVSVRLGVEDVSETTTYAAIAVGALQGRLEEAGCTAQQSASPLPCTAEEYLWHYFATTEFRNRAGDVIYPVLVFDQFEELFFREKNDLALFLKQVYLLLDDSSLPPALTGGGDVTNFRLLFSIREDDFFRLEDIVERMNLMEMKYNRYRLTEMSDSEAAEVITEPAATLISPADATEIAQRVTAVAKDENGNINSAILSLLCSRLYDATVGAGASTMEFSSVSSFLESSAGNLLASFYDDVIKRLKDRKKWEYIEDELVTEDGRRNSVLKSQFDKNVPGCGFLFKGEYAMLRTVTYSSGKEPHVEIIHDLLAAQMKASRNERHFKAEAEKMRRRQHRNLFFIIIAALLLAVFAYQYWSILKGRDNLLITQSRYLASEAKKLYDTKQYSKALRLALHALPGNCDNPDRPYVPEAESMLRSAYNAQTYNTGITILQHSYDVRSASFSPCGKYIVTASEDNTARVWDTITGSPVGEPMRHNGSVNSASFSPCGKYIVTASEDFTARVWDALTGKPIGGEPMRHNNDVYSASFSPCGKYILTRSLGNTACVWNVFPRKSDSRDVWHNGEIVSSASFSPCGKYIVTASWDFTARVWNAATGSPVGAPMQHFRWVNTASFSPCGKYIVTASSDNTARVWDALTGKPIGGEPMRHNDVVSSASFSPCGKYIVTASYDNTACVWETITGKLIGEPLQHSGDVISASFSPSGEYILTQTRADTVRVWNAKYGDLVCKLPCSSWLDASFSPCGKYVVTGWNDYAACVWEIPTGKIVCVTLNHYSGVNFASFSPCGKYIVTASLDHTARVWDALTGTPVSEPMRHNYLVNSALFSPCGEYIVTASDDKTARVWDAATGKPVSEPMEHNDEVDSASFSPDGKSIMTLSGGKVTIYPFLPLQELIDKYRKSDIDWSLSEEEMKEYCLD